MMLWIKKIKSNEYLELFNMIERLRIELTSLKLDVEIYKSKLKAVKSISKDNENKSIYSSMLLPEE